MSPLPAPRIYNPSTDAPFLHDIARLHAACITTDHTLATFLPPLSHDKILASWTAWSEQVAAGNRVIILQLTEEDVLAGVVSLFMPETETGKHRSEVGRLLVSPDFRKRGLAREMMGVLEQVAREKERWMVVRVLVPMVLTYELLADGLTASRYNNRQRSRACVPKIGLQENRCCTQLWLQSEGRQPGRRDFLLQRCKARLRRITAICAGCCTFGIEGIDNVQLAKTMIRNFCTSPVPYCAGFCHWTLPWFTLA